ncbi:MAG: nucleotidyltransferase domain-containing protein [Terriglobia bacterium]|jgi:predicted nucleotidyltransferase
MTAATLDKIVQDTVGRILSVTSPKQVFLFGSAVRGDLHDNSDIDLLVVVPNGTPRRKTAQRIYRNLIGLRLGADIVVVTEEDIEKYRDAEGWIIGEALAEGRLVYGA